MMIRSKLGLNARSGYNFSAGRPRNSADAKMWGGTWHLNAAASNGVWPARSKPQNAGAMTIRAASSV